MAIKIKARVLLELGSELISSDPIALYELLKNSLDAGGEAIKVTANIEITKSDYQRVREALVNGIGSAKSTANKRSREALSSEALSDLLRELVDPLIPEDSRNAFIRSVVSVPVDMRVAALDRAYNERNWIEISDNGSGMSLEDLNNVYLTIGTPNRLLQRLGNDSQPGGRASGGRHLGEKGIGRLSAMRLGDQLFVRTGKAGTDGKRGNDSWHELSANWALLKDDQNMDLEDFPVSPADGKKKARKEEHGTVIRISALQGDWYREKLELLAKTDFAKLIDPFKMGIPRPDIRFFLNGESLAIPSFERSMLQAAHASCTANFHQTDEFGPVLEGAITYRAYGRTKNFRLTGEHLRSALSEPRKKPKSRAANVAIAKHMPHTAAVDAGLQDLGPFEVEAYWFNRQKLRLDKIEGYESVLHWLGQWGGGLMLYRDNFRVYPYAEVGDDWLDLDAAALGSSGYKLNRKQLVGAVRITGENNPALQDQTNREGLRENEVKRALVAALRVVLITEFKNFLNTVEGETTKSAEKDFKKLESRVGEIQGKTISQIKRLRGIVPPSEIETINKLLAHVEDLVISWEKAKMTIHSQKDELERYIHLAGIGLMTEFVFHELARITAATLETLKRYRTKENAPENRQLTLLRAQLVTLDKRIRILDPTSTPGRQSKELVNIAELITAILDAHQAQFERHEIQHSVVLVGSKKKFEQRVVKGQIVQILENLISNSVYWLGQQLSVRHSESTIQVILDTDAREIHFRDTGPGVSVERGEEVFEAFCSTKPPGLGRGLGLYISRKLAEYNEATISLEQAREGAHHGFIVKFN